MTTPGLPLPPPPGETALQPGTFDGTCVFVTGGGTGLGKAIASEFARLEARFADEEIGQDPSRATRARMASNRN